MTSPLRPKFRASYEPNQLDQNKKHLGFLLELTWWCWVLVSLRPANTLTWFCSVRGGSVAVWRANSSKPTDVQCPLDPIPDTLALLARSGLRREQCEQSPTGVIPKDGRRRRRRGWLLNHHPNPPVPSCQPQLSFLCTNTPFWELQGAPPVVHGDKPLVFLQIKAVYGRPHLLWFFHWEQNNGFVTCVSAQGKIAVRIKVPHCPLQRLL